MGNVLIGCERSGVVREAFRKQGHDAWSCDLEPAEDGSPYHLQCDVFEAIASRHWDLAIFHPECTYLCSSGLHWNHKRPERKQKTEEALEFVQLLLDCGIERIALENPTGCISTRIRPYDDKVQPYEFGHDASKGTCLWLKNLPPLVRDPALAYPPRYVCRDCGNVMQGYAGACSRCAGERVSERWGNQTNSGQNRLGPSETRWMERARTYQGIADAFAKNWGPLI